MGAGLREPDLHLSRERAMANVVAMIDEDVERQRARNYNATLLDVIGIHEDLRIVRVRPDRGIPDFHAGQYTVLGLGNWEPRVAGVQTETLDAPQRSKVVKRAYSICCPMLDAEGRLVRARDLAYFEFLITLVRRSKRRPPALTPRLFGLEAGDRLFCGPHVHGNYTLHGVHGDYDVVLAATGSGEAPHNAMIANLLANQHRGRIISVVCTRWKRDLAYLSKHRMLEERYGNYRYLTLTTREPENVDPNLPGFVGKRYLQDYFELGQFERDVGIELSPDRTHIFLCGSPAMIGVPLHTQDPAKRYPEPKGMVEVLEARGFNLDRPHEPGSLHFEKYW